MKSAHRPTLRVKFCAAIYMQFKHLKEGPSIFHVGSSCHASFCRKRLASALFFATMTVA